MGPARLQDAIRRQLIAAWRSFGLPLASQPIVEREMGLVDPEALLVLTLLYVEDGRLLSDVQAWVAANSDLLLRQKLASLQRVLGTKERKHTEEKLATSGMVAPLEGASRIPGRGPQSFAEFKDAMGARVARFAPRPEVARQARVLRNRLLFGVGFRADVVSIIECRARPVNGRALARLLATNFSTVSRILADLVACEFIDSKGRLPGHEPPFPGLFISCDSARHIPALIDAVRATNPSLRRAMLPSIDPGLDALGASILARCT